MCSFVGFNCNYTSDSWIFLEWALTCIPLRQFRSLANKALQVVTLWMAASNKGAHHVSIVGLGISPSHALNIIALHFLSPNKEDSKYLFCLGDLVGCPQIVSTRREWSKSLRLDVATSICPPRRVQVLSDKEFVNARDSQMHFKHVGVEGVLLLGHFSKVVQLPSIRQPILKRHMVPRGHLSSQHEAFPCFPSLVRFF
jgi:hypothetical protein